MIKVRNSPRQSKAIMLRKDTAVWLADELPSDSSTALSVGLLTNSAITASPIRATQRLTTKMASYCSGAMLKIATASSGPITAPAVSMARCTPKAVANCSG